MSKQVGGIDWASEPSAIVSYLDQHGPTLVLTPAVDEMVSHLDVLEALPVVGSPWAGLIVCEAVSNSVGPAIARTRLEQVRAEFEQAGDEIGLGYCRTFDGLNALSVGNLSIVASAFAESREKLGPQSPHIEHLLAASSWTSYETGDLQNAIRIAEEALGQARVRSNKFGEGVAWFHLGYFHLWTGEFTASDLALAEAVVSLESDDIFEMALTIGAQAVLASLRGQIELADRLFQTALDARVTRARNDRWLESVILASRAEFMSGTHPERSLNDARSARASLKQLGDTWWVNWALLATAVALGCGGQPTASRKVFDELLEADQKPLERARTHLRYGEMLLATADYAGARKQFDQAAAAFEGTRADYWTMRSLIGSISSRSPRAAALRRRALPLTKPDPIHRAAWRGNSTIAVSVIGTEQVIVNGVPARFETQRAEAAFFQLALAGPGGVAKDQLAVSLWPDASQIAATRNVRTVLWQIRRALGTAGERLQHDQRKAWLDIDGDDVDLNRAIVQRSADGTTRDDDRITLLPRFSDEEWVVRHQRNLDALRDK